MPKRTYPKVKEIPEYSPRPGVKPKAVVLISPHMNESGAVFPFQTELAKKLREDGIQTQEHLVKDIMSRGWSLRKKFNRPPYWNESPVITNILGFEDYLIRARIMKRALVENAHSLVIEMHASNFSADDEFADAKDFERIPGTSILVLKNITRNLGFLDLDVM